MLPCLTLSIIRKGSRIKWSNPGKEVVPYPTPWCCSYRKGRLWVTLNYSHQQQLTTEYLLFIVDIVNTTFQIIYSIISLRFISKERGFFQQYKTKEKDGSKFFKYIISSVWKLDIIWRVFHDQWPIGTDG